MNTELTAKQTARIQRIRAERAERKVDQRDSPNVFPYKKCAFCHERSSCGNYTDDDEWKCESCAPENDCICESDEKPNHLCPDHQCCWACGTQSVPVTLNDKRGLWLCGGCDKKCDSCPRIQARRRENNCACGCKGKSCVSCGAHVQQRDQYVLVERKHIHCLWCYKDKKKREKRSTSMV